MKDVYTLFSEAIEALRKSPAKEKQFRSLVPLGAKVPVEVQLNCAKEVLAGKVEEAQRVVKHNGVGDNGTLLTESAGSFSEVVDPREAQVNGYMVSCNITEAEARKVLGLAPKGLSLIQATHYALAVAAGLNESQALQNCKQ